MQSNLYSKNATSFSNTRNSPWDGWLKLKDHLKKAKSVLDIGCGNGRFLKFLLDNKIQLTSYVGVDNSRELLSIARSIFTDFEDFFLEADVEESSWSRNLDKKFDLIVLFGVMHHIKKQSRSALLKSCNQLLTEDGQMVITYWKFKDDDKFFNNHLVEDLGEEDYILSFKSDKITRFCHYYTDQEILELEKTAGLEIVDEFRADGKSCRMNLYKIYSN